MQPQQNYQLIYVNGYQNFCAILWLLPCHLPATVLKRIQSIMSEFIEEEMTSTTFPLKSLCIQVLQSKQNLQHKKKIKKEPAIMEAA